MNSSPRLIVIALAVLCVSGCATVRTADNAHRGSPKIYGGTRLNLAALSGDDASLGDFRQYGIRAPSAPALDLPLSLIADTLLLPYAIHYTATEPVVGRK